MICDYARASFLYLCYLVKANQLSIGTKLIDLHCLSYIVLSSAEGKIPAVKFQMAFFEALGWQGFKILEELISYSKSKNYLTILDAKRGDISTTMKAYGQMAFDCMKVDALTVQPYMGSDIIEPLIPWLNKGSGIYIVFMSSNTSGHYLQNLSTHSPTVAQQIFNHFDTYINKKLLNKSVGLVVGASQLKFFVDLLKDEGSEHPLLIPGLGAQKGEIGSEWSRVNGEGSKHLISMSRALFDTGSSNRHSNSAEFLCINDFLDYFSIQLNKYRLEFSRPSY